MKNLVVSLLIALFSSVSLANISSDNEFLLNRGLGEVGNRTQVGTLLNKTAAQLIAKYSFAVQGGSTSADINLLTDLNNTASLAKLPDNAVIRQVYVEVLTPPTSNSGSATISLETDESDADLMADKALAFFGVGFVGGTPSGATTTFVKLSAERTLNMDLGEALNSDLTAGKFNVIIDYVLSE